MINLLKLNIWENKIYSFLLFYYKISRLLMYKFHKFWIYKVVEIMNQFAQKEFFLIFEWPNDAFWNVLWQ